MHVSVSKDVNVVTYTYTSIVWNSQLNKTLSNNCSECPVNVKLNFIQSIREVE